MTQPDIAARGYNQTEADADRELADERRAIEAEAVRSELDTLTERVEHAIDHVPTHTQRVVDGKVGPKTRRRPEFVRLDCRDAVLAEIERLRKEMGE